MSSQINLLPDIKLEYLRSRKLRRMVIVLCTIALLACGGILFVFGSYVFGVQKLQLNNANNDIAGNIKQLKSIQDLDKIVTVQNQIGALSALHDSKPAISNIATYLRLVTPSSATISDFTLDYSTNTGIIKGTVASVEVVNRFVDTLKFTKFTSKDSTDSSKAFNSVVLDRINVSDKGTDYTISFGFNPVIFDLTKLPVKLEVPKITSTRSDLTVPNALFNEPLPEVNSPATTSASSGVKK
jgi:hypothetical protein